MGKKNKAKQNNHSSINNKIPITTGNETKKEPLFQLNSHKIMLLIILITGFFLRVYFVNADKYTQVKYFPKDGIGYGSEELLGWDGVRYDWIATNIIDGKGYGYYANQPDAWRPPGYPLFLASIYWLFGKDYGLIRVFQAFFSFFTIILVYIISKEVFGKKTALFASLICALYYDMIVFPLIFYTEVLFAFFSTLAICLILFFNKFDGKSKTALWCYLIITGVISGYCALIRPVFLQAIPFLLIAVAVKSGFNSLFIKKALIFFIGVVIAVAPWCIRNTVLNKKLTFISTNGGLNLAIGFSQNATGHFKGDNNRFTPDEEKIIKEKGHASVAYTFIKENPVKASILFIKKIWLQLFCPSYKNFAQFFPDNPVPMFCYTPVVFFLFLLGVIISFLKINPDLYLIYSYLISYILFGAVFFYMGDRHRLPLVFVYSMFGGLCLSFLWDYLSALWKKR